MMSLKTKEKGYVITIITFFILIIMLAVGLSMSALVAYSQKVSTALVKSAQSYYAAESGVEDALLRLNDNPQLSATSYTLTVAGASTTVTIPAIVGGSRSIVSEGDLLNRKRKIQVVYSINSTGISFYYGAQVGAGGLQMGNGSVVEGNVFSNGNIQGSGTIDNDAIVAGNGHYIDDVHVGGNALAYSCLSPAVVEGNLTYVTGGTRTCTVQGSIATQSSEIPDQPFPISDEQVDIWKSEATQGQVISGNITLSNGQTKTLGPVKIVGNLTVDNNAILTMAGTIYVTGNVSISNNGRVTLAASYGSLGGVLLADGDINVGNNGIVEGSGQTGSYLLLLSTSSNGTAISISNNAAGAVFYAGVGGISVSNNTTARELTGYSIDMSNNSVISYESGLQNTFFSSGPGGGWQVDSWEEK